MKNMTIAILLTVLGSLAWSQEASVYVSECKMIRNDRISQENQDYQPPESMQRKIEIKDNDIMLTQTNFSDFGCQVARNKYVTIGQLAEGKSLNIKIALFNASYMIRSPLPINTPLLRILGYSSLSEEKVAQLPVVVRNATLGLTGAIQFYQRTRFEAMAKGTDVEANTNGLTTISFDETAQSLIYNQQAMVLQK